MTRARDRDIIDKLIDVRIALKRQQCVAAESDLPFITDKLHQRPVRGRQHIGIAARVEKARLINQIERLAYICLAERQRIIINPLYASTGGSRQSPESLQRATIVAAEVITQVEQVVIGQAP